MLRRLLVVAVAAAAVASPAAAATLTPTAWPQGPTIGSAPNAIRFAGADRYATSQAIALGLRGRGELPFGSPDPTTGSWWGVGVCPGSIIVVAGDRPADALAATPLSDPTNRSNEPRLQRSASADPAFDVVGGFDRVDTASAPIIVTASTRTGATVLSAAARTAAADLRANGCSAREAIIVGGAAAVPVGVDAELVALGYEEVFRVAGSDRFETAAAIAGALGGEAATPGLGCVDPSADDGSTEMGFYGNGVIEYRSDASTCELHGRAVVLAEGTVGADALAAGWWTSYWQVPVLLVDEKGALPPATRSALSSLAVDTIVVLGGVGRIPEEVAEEAAALAGAVVGRFGGNDRYETSVLLAQAFGGWYPTGTPTDFDGDRLCVTASTGTLGWQDALSSGPWCGALTARGTPAPSRVQPPVESAAGPVPAVPPAHHAAPILLVPSGADALPPSLRALLDQAFVAKGRWCTGLTAPDCLAPGFAVAFGGRDRVTEAALVDLSARLAGGAAHPRPSTSTGAFWTALDLDPVYAVVGADGAHRACVRRGTTSPSARWLALYTTDLRGYRGGVDLPARALQGDGAGNDPVCLAYRAGDPSASVEVTPWGSTGPVTVLRSSVEETTELSAPVLMGPANEVSGVSATARGPGSTSYVFEAQVDDRRLRTGTRAAAVERAALTVTLRRTDRSEVADLDGVVSLRTQMGDLAGTVRAEALPVGERWEIAGTFETSTEVGGFRATLRTFGTETNADDELLWRLDLARR